MRTFREYLSENLENIYHNFVVEAAGPNYAKSINKVIKNSAQKSYNARQAQIKNRDLGRKAAKAGMKIGTGAAKKSGRFLAGNKKYVAAVAVGALLINRKRNLYHRDRAKLLNRIEKAGKHGDYNAYYGAKIKLAKISGRYGGKF